jgi:uncharacterized protein involved in exopolysaccharide biosynthesis
MSTSRPEDNVVYPPLPTGNAPLRLATSPQLGPAEALRRRWPIAVLVTLFCLGAGLAVGLTRSPVYSAESRLSVGRFDISAPGAISTFAVATQSLAAQYSRTINARPIVDQVSRRTGVPATEVSTSLSATPIPESPIFTIKSKTTSEARSVAIASATSDALVAYTTRLNRSNPDSARLFRRFNAAALKLNRLSDRQQRLTRAVNAGNSGASRDALAQLRTQVQAATLDVDTLRTAYESSRSSQAATELVQVLTRPATAASDRWSVLQLYLATGLAVGLLLGTALALLFARRGARRALAG